MKGEALEGEVHQAMTVPSSSWPPSRSLGLAKMVAADDEHAPATAELITQVMADTDEAAQTLRELAHGIYPPLLASDGLKAALRGRLARAPLPVDVEADGLGRYPQEVEAAVYFCCLEAVQNVVKYADAAALGSTSRPKTACSASPGRTTAVASTPRPHQGAQGYRTWSTDSTPWAERCRSSPSPALAPG